MTDKPETTEAPEPPPTAHRGEPGVGIASEPDRGGLNELERFEQGLDPIKPAKKARAKPAAKPKTEKPAEESAKDE